MKNFLILYLCSSALLYSQNPNLNIYVAFYPREGGLLQIAKLKSAIPIPDRKFFSSSKSSSPD